MDDSIHVDVLRNVAPGGVFHSNDKGLNDEHTLHPSNESLAHTWLSLRGDQPTFNDWESFVIDYQREILYSYGGVRPYDKSITPTSDFHCLDLKTMEWRNLCVGAFN